MTEQKSFMEQVRDDVRPQADELAKKDDLTGDDLIKFAVHFRNRERALRRKRNKENKAEQADVRT